MKVCLFIALALLSFSVANCDIYSGIKVAVDTELAKLVQNLDLTKQVNGTSLLGPEGIVFEKSGLLGYRIFVKKLTVDTFKTPDVIEVTNTPEAIINDLTMNGRTEFRAKNMVMTFFSDFDAKVSLVSDSVTNAPLKIVIDQIDGEFYFKDGQIHFTKFSVVVGEVDIKFNSAIFKAFFKLLKGLIVGEINKMIPTYQEVIEKALNKVVNEELVIKVPQIELFFNATMVDKPDLDFFSNQISSELIPNKVHNIIHSFMTQFLETPITEELVKSRVFDSNPITSSYNQKVSATHTSTVLKAGIRGALFVDPKHELKVVPAVNMAYSVDTQNRGVNLLLSDYTINTILYVLQDTGLFVYKLTNSTIIPDLGFNIDTEGLSSILPELHDSYPVNRKAEVTFLIPSNGNVQPQIKTTTDKSEVKTTFILTIAVQESDDDFDDPKVVFVSEVDIVVDLSSTFNQDKLDVNILKNEITDIRVSSQTINPDINRFKINLNNLLINLDNLLAPKLKGIDISAFVEKYLTVHLSGFNIKHENGYLSAALNIHRK